ncbi:MAG: hypothetical protein IKS07_09355 [Lachnospiraceae bacterium]|nr:hypothetical protein [Lachnospiraceae bacterium]
MPRSVNELEQQKKSGDSEYKHLVASAKYLSGVLTAVAAKLTEQGEEDAAFDYRMVSQHLIRATQDPSDDPEKVSDSIGMLNSTGFSFLQKMVDGLPNYLRIRDFITQDVSKSDFEDLTDMDLDSIVRTLMKGFDLDQWSLKTFKRLEEAEQNGEYDQNLEEDRFSVVDQEFHEEEKPDALKQQEQFEAALKKDGQVQPAEGEKKPEDEVNPQQEQKGEEKGAPQEENADKVNEAQPNVPQAEPVATAEPGEVSYRRYIELHTGENAAMLKDEDQLTCLGNCIAAMWLEDRKRSFDVKAIHALGAQLKDIYSLDQQTTKTKVFGLQSPANIRTLESVLANDIYGVKKDSVANWQNALTGLYEHMQVPRITNSTEYKKLYAAVQKAATAKDPSEKDIARLNMEILVRTENYIKGKDTLRQFEGGRNRFDYAMDALSILQQYTNADKTQRITKRVDVINDVRSSRGEPTVDMLRHNGRTSDWGTEVAERRTELQLQPPNRTLVK